MLKTDSMMGKPKNTTEDKPASRKYDKPVLPEDPPARMKISQKYKRADDGAVVPEEYVTITYNHIGRGKGGQFKVPRTWLETLWKSLQ